MKESSPIRVLVAGGDGSPRAAELLAAAGAA
ncbi:MAG: hypothetical protein JWM27_2952, partial [Gemmatimonadetes bacterium]|nr:hypothetical protein [Gemmatimonadota bacterium]